MIDSKKYVFRCVAVVGVLIVCIVGLNWWQDPAGIFGNKNTYDGVAKASCEGKSLVVSGNYNERMFTKSVIECGSNDYDVLVLGSSRVMSIGEEYVNPHMKLRSLAVSGAVLEDDIAIWHNYLEHMATPPKIVIIDGAPWLFNSNSGETRWTPILAEDYRAGLNELGIDEELDDDSLSRYRSLLSMKYTRESCKKIIHPAPPLDIWEKPDKSEDSMIICGDGSRIYDRKTLSGDSDMMAKTYIKGDIYHVEGYEELDGKKQEIFTGFVKSIQSKGIKVVIFLSPYHPLVYDYLKQQDKYKNVFIAEQWFKDFAITNNVTLIGSYNPADMHLTGKDFFDGMHMQRESQGGYLRHTLAERHFWDQ